MDQNLSAVGIVVMNSATEIVHVNHFGRELLNKLGANASHGCRLDFLKLTNKHNRPNDSGDLPYSNIAPYVSGTFSINSQNQTEWYTYQIDRGAHYITISLVLFGNLPSNIPFDKVVNNLQDVVMITTAQPKPKIVYANKQFTAMSGYTLPEVVDRSPSLLQGKDTCLRAKSRIDMALRQRKPVREQLLNYTKDGREYWVEIAISPIFDDTGEVAFFSSIQRDITEEKKKEKTLDKLANFDPLTGLLNRRGFQSAAIRAANHSKENPKTFIVAVIDIDNFKYFNDNFGHEVGDLVLKLIANLLKSKFRKKDFVARLGGDEFAILIASSHPVKAEEKLENMCNSIANRSFTVKNNKIRVTISAGSHSCMQAEFSLKESLRKADLALYKAKNSGKSKLVRYRV